MKYRQKKGWILKRQLFPCDDTKHHNSQAEIQGLYSLCIELQSAGGLCLLQHFWIDATTAINSQEISWLPSSPANTLPMEGAAESDLSPSCNSASPQEFTHLEKGLNIAQDEIYIKHTRWKERMCILSVQLSAASFTSQI